MLTVRRGTKRWRCSMLCAEHDMKITLDDTAAVGELVGFLRSFDCSAQEVGPHVVSVEFQQRPEGDQASDRLDLIRLEAFIRVWNFLHPSVQASFLDEQPVHSI